MVKKRVLASAAVALLLSAGLAFATGYFPGFPAKGGPSYCAGYVSNGSSLCSSTVPAGTTSFSGNEAVPFDDYGPLANTAAGAAAGSGAAPQTEFVSVLQLGNGGFQNLASTTSATSVTVLPTTSVLFENATVTNPTITFTASPLQGQIFTLIWGANLTTGITTAAGSGSTCLPACGAIAVTTAGTTHKWIYEGTIWYQMQ
jgi:hypothetical protein